MRSLSRSLATGLAFCACLLPVAVSAQDSATVEVSIQKSPLVRVSKIDEWLIAATDATGTIGFWEYDWDYLCVYSSTGRFDVNVSGANAASTFEAVSGSSVSMAYEVWSFSRTNVVFTGAVRHTGPFTLANRRGSTDLDCADEGYQNSNLFFAPLVRGADFNTAPPGIYRDVVTITVSPV